MMHQAGQAFGSTPGALVSIIIPFSTHGEFLDQAIQRVKEQDYLWKEIIVDDGSPIPGADLSISAARY